MSEPINISPLSANNTINDMRLKVNEIALTLSGFSAHTANTSNPHSVTASQVGLGNVTNESKSTMFSNPVFTGNTTIANTYISGVLTVANTTLVTNLNADLLDGQHGTYYTANSAFALHTANTSNPHSVTATQVGLGNVTNESKTTMFSNPVFTGNTTIANTSITGVLTVANTTLVTNLNADLLDGQHLSDLDSRYVNVSGDTMTANLTVQGTTTTNKIQYNTSFVDGVAQQGESFWNSTQRTYNYGLGNGVVGQAFQELYYPLVKNNTAFTIPNGTAVAASGSDNGNRTIVPYISDGTMSPDSYIGLATEDIVSGGFGLVTYFGRVNDLNTSAWNVGTVLYASDSIAGTYSDVSPTAPSDLTIIGIVSKEGTTDGAVDVRLDIKPRSDQIPYDHTASGMNATNVKGALDELQSNKADIGTLSSNINLYPSTANSNITDYQTLVTSTEDPRYNTIENDFAFTVTTTAQLLATRVADAGIFVGNPGVITVTYLPYLKKTDSNQTKYSEFFWRLYKRNSANTETLIGESTSSGDVTQTNFSVYPMYLTLNDGAFEETDRLVIRTYANSMTGSNGGSYVSRLGGQNPSKILLPVPANVIPTPPASSVQTDTTNFNHILSSADTTVQAALDKLDDYAAPLYSPTFTGTPNAPTAAFNANTTQIATTAFVQTVIGSVTVDNADKLDGYHANSFPLLSGLLGGQTLIGGSGVTDKLVLQGTSGNGTSTSAALQVNVGNNGATNAVTVLNNGNVGVGTTSPSQLLTVGNSNQFSVTSGGNVTLNGASPTILKLQYSGNTGYFTELRNNYSVTNPFQINVTGYDRFGVANTNDTYLNAYNMIRFSTNNNSGTYNDSYTRMVITNTGNVGIGLTTPTSKLHIQGSGTTSSTSSLNVTDSAGSSKLFVRDDGNVGIGTTSPGYALDVNGRIRATIVMYIKGDSVAGTGMNGYLDFTDSAGTEQAFFGRWAGAGTESFLISSSKGLWLSGQTNGPTAATTNLVVSTTGNVGIGTTSPSSKLQVQGSGTTTGVTLQTQDSTGTAKFKVLDSGITSITSNDSSALTDLTINPTLKTSGNLLDLQLNGTSKFKVDYTGTITTDSPTLVTNLNADLLDGQHSSYYATSTLPTFTGTASFNGSVAIKNSLIDSKITSLTSTTQTSIFLFTANAFRTAKFLVQIVDSTNSQYHSTEILVIHDGTTVSLVQYATIYTAAELGTFDATITSGTLNLYFTATTASTKVVNVYATLIASEYVPYGVSWNESADTYTTI